MTAGGAPRRLWAEFAYLPGMSLLDFMEHARAHHPELHGRIAAERISGAALEVFRGHIGSAFSHFETREQGGRGEAFGEAQRLNARARAAGILPLFELAAPADGPLTREHCVVDVLGGNGTLARTLRDVRGRDADLPVVLTSDVAASMVADALRQGLPAIRQPAQYLLLADGTADAVIVAYGTHHIPPGERPDAVREAWRVLRRGGRIVMQDFEPGTLTARWYSELVHQNSPTGHDFAHLGRAEMTGLLEGAGFERVRVVDVYDPFILHGRTPGEAVDRMVDYLVALYSLDTLRVAGPGTPVDRPRAEALIRRYSTFGPGEPFPFPPATPRELSVARDGDGYRAELPRVAQVAVGERTS